MNKFKEEADNDVCIRDLKQLGKEGGATAYLDNGQIVKLKAKYGTISKKGYIAGFFDKPNIFELWLTKNLDNYPANEEIFPLPEKYS